MTSLDVAPGTAPTTSSPPRVPVAVTKRIREWSGGVIWIKVPKVVRTGTFKDDQVEIPFIQFARPVPGGVVNIFMHTADVEKYVGREITAKAEVHYKEMADGRAFYHIDLYPTDEPASHQLIVEPRQNTVSPAKATVFKTPSPLQGEIVIKTIEASKPTSTGDVQLDRLLADRWQISHQDDKAVYLTKGERQITHYRPKARGKVR